MTMEEVEDRTPNGLHDAYLLGFSVDYSKQLLTLNLNWLTGIPEGKTPEERRGYLEGTLTIHGLRYFVIEAPAKGDGDAPDQIKGFVTDADDILRCNLPTVEADVFRHTLYLGYWESFIHFAGVSADVTPTNLLVHEMGQ